MTKKKNVGVFCGARNGSGEAFKQLAEECGRLIGENNHRLVYGGCSTGLMGILSNAVTKSGGEVCGVFPNNVLKDSEELNLEMNETLFVDNMHDRKKEIIERSDLFVILPGGFGTLDEFFEVLTLKSIGVNNKPLYIVNLNGYWNTLIMLIENVCANEFACHKKKLHYYVVENVRDIFKDLS